MAYLAINGRILPDTDACLSPLDRGFLYGDGLFETLKVDGKRIYFLEKHLARMQEGARFLRIPFPADIDFPCVLQELRERNGIRGEASAKICLTRGRHRNSLFLDPPSSPTVVILLHPYQSPTPGDWEKGLSVTLEREILQNDSSSLCRIKSLNYLLYLLVRTRARDRGYEDAILTNRANEICEATTSNLFFFRQGRLETPALSCGLLPGVLRQALMECLGRAGQPVREVKLAPEALHSCEEIFVTNSLVEILPVGRVDQRAYDRRERTRRVQEQFQAFRDEKHPGHVLR
jgi:branched-chain amino acid aminotransferase